MFQDILSGLCETFLKTLTDSSHEVSRILHLRRDAFHEICEILGHDTFIEGIQASSLKLVCVVHELRKVVQFLSLIHI